MDIPREPERVIDVEGDDLETVARKLGVGSTLEAERIVLTEENLKYLNDERDKDGETFLIRFTRLGKEDIVEFLVKCEGIRVNDANKLGYRAAEIALSEGKFGCLLKLLQGEAWFPPINDLSQLQGHTSLLEFVEQRQKLHRDIESGDLNLVTGFIEDHKFTEADQLSFLERLWKHKIKSLGNKNSKEECLRCLSAIEMIRRKIGDILEKMEDFDLDLVQSLKDLKENVEKSDSKMTCHEKLETLWTGIESLDFTRTATLIIEKAAIKVDNSMFLGIPLHLLMLGNVAYDNNFRLGVLSNVHKLYSDFVEGKIRIYWKEKTNSEYAGHAKKRLDRERVLIMNFHKRIAKCVIDPDSYPWDSVADSADLGLDVSVGILTKSGDKFQFVHRTFAEFFFCEWLLEMLERGTLEEEKVIEVLREDRHSVVRRFVDGALQRGDIKYELNDELIKTWNLEAIFDICVGRAHKKDFTGNYLLRDILTLYMKCDNLVKVFFKTVSKILFLPEYSLDYDIFKLLSVTFPDAMLSEFFIKHVEPEIGDVLFFIRYSPADGVSGVLEAFRRVYRFRARHCRSENNSDGHLEENEGSADSREADRVGDGGENRMTLFEGKDCDGCNVLHCAASNKDENVLFYAIELATELLGKEELVKLALEREEIPRFTIMHRFCCIDTVKDIVRPIIFLESILDSTSLFDMLRAKGFADYNFLFLAADFYSNNFFLPLIEYLREIKGVNLLKDLLFEKDCNEWNILHHIARNEDIGVFETTLKYARMELDEEKFTEFVMGVDNEGRTVFHHRASWISHSISDLTILLERYVERDGLRELLVKTNNKKETWLHKLNEWNYNNNAALDGLSIISYLIEGDSVEKFILATDVEENTMLHSFAKYWNRRHYINSYQCDEWNEIMSALKGLLNESSFEKLINKRNKKGKIARIVEYNKLKLRREERSESEGESDWMSDWESDGECDGERGNSQLLSTADRGGGSEEESEKEGGREGET